MIAWVPKSLWERSKCAGWANRMSLAHLVPADILFGRNFA